MAQTVLITLTIAGADTGPFNLYSNADGYVSAFETGVSKASLVAGYLSVLVPDGATIIRVKSTGVCPNYIDLSIDGITTTTTTTSSSSTTSTTTSTSTAVPCNDYYNNTGGTLNGINYTGCDGTPYTSQSVAPGQSICVQGNPTGGDSGFLTLLGNC